MTKSLNPPLFLKFVRRPIIPLILIVALTITGTLVLNSHIPRTGASQTVVITIPETTGATKATDVVCEETPEATIHMDALGVIILEITATTEEKINLTTAYWNLKLYVEIWKDQTLQETVEFVIIKEGVIFIDGLADSCSLLAGDHDVVVKTDYETIAVTEVVSGTFTIKIHAVKHDVAIIDVTPSTDEAYAGQTVNVEVEAENQGTEFETFTVTTYYNDTVIGTKTITLAPDANTTVTFNWNTTDVTPCTNYTIKAEASTVPGETETADNTYEDGTVHIRIAGDIDGDGDVDPDDFYIFAGAYGTKQGDPHYNAYCDIDGDGDVDPDDFYIFAGNYGKSCGE